MKQFSLWAMVLVSAVSLLAMWVLTGFSVAQAQSIPDAPLAIDPTAGTYQWGALFRVDPTTGQRTLLSDFGNTDQGPTGGHPFGVAVEVSGAIVVINPDAGTNFRGALFRVDSTTGQRTLLSDFGNTAQGPLGADPARGAVAGSGAILVIDFNAGTDGRGVLFRVDPTTGQRTLLSDFGNTAQGPLGADPFDVALPSEDADSDGVPDGIDNCPNTPNPPQEDLDGDGIGDVCDPCPVDPLNDVDGDGICGNVDNCSVTPNTDQIDTDGDGIGNACDADDDGDGVLDAVDQCLNTPVGAVVNAAGCAIDQLCPCENNWKNHGAYVSCIAHTAEDFVADSLITETEKDTVVSAAGASNCGYKK
jgi:hypothetical protein